MCGRFSLFASPDDVEARFDAAFAHDFEPTYNAAPGQGLPVLTDAAPETIQGFEWGFVPHSAETRSDGEFVNARAKTVRETPGFATAFEGREAPDDGDGDGPAAGRCLVPADGFYEWTDSDRGRQPYRVTLAGDDLFAMAGLWTRWEPPQVQTGLDGFGDDSPRPAAATTVETFAVLTTEPNEAVAELHDRMPVVLDSDDEATWLGGDADEAADLLDPYPAERTRAYPVSTAVNDPGNDHPALVEEVDLGP